MTGQAFGSPLRLWHQSMTELAGLEGYRRRLELHAAALFGDRLQLDVHGLAEGTYAGVAPTGLLGYPYVQHLVARQAIAAAVRAEQQGYDGFVIGSFSEPALREIRSAVDIPVVSLNESTLLIGCSFGRRIALVANSTAVADLVSASVERHHLGDRVLTVRSIEPGLTEHELMAGDPEHVLAVFTATARSLAADGAEVIVPAEGVMCELLYESGLTEVDGVPVLDSVGTTWAHAGLLVDLWRQGTRVNRARAYPRLDPDVRARLDAAAVAAVAAPLTDQA